MNNMHNNHNNQGGKFLQGAMVGLALGIAANLFLQSKAGKKLKEGVSEMAADFYDSVAPKIKKLGEITEEQYKEFMDKAVDQYVKAKKISVEMAQDLKEEVMDSWNYFMNHAEEEIKDAKK